MTRIRKATGLAVALAACAALMAPAAQAETGALTAPEFPAIVTGEQAPGVSFDIGELPAHQITCGISRLDGTLMGPSDPTTFIPKYANCISDPAGTPTTVTLNGCDYLIGWTKPGTTGWGPNTGGMQGWINCPAGQRIEIHVYENGVKHGENISTCTYDIPPQGPVPAGVYHNTGAGIPDVDPTINARFTGVSTIGAGFLPCGGDPMTGDIPVTVTGQYTLRGFQDFGFFEGAQIPLDVG